MKKALFLFAPILLLFTCSVPTYFDTNKSAYTLLQKEEYKTAFEALEKNKYLKEEYNNVLYLLEKGRLAYLYGAYTEAFKLLDEADNLCDSWKEIKVRDIQGNITVYQKSTNGPWSTSSSSSVPGSFLTGPRKLEYRPEHFERMMIHYTKAMALLQLGRNDDALVEARKLQLLSQRMDDLKNTEPQFNQYISSPFPQLLMALLYEKAGEFNNAFVAYENAYKKFSQPQFAQMYGLPLPTFLKKGMIGMARRIDFSDKVKQYEKELGYEYKGQQYEGGELVLFVENGLAPVKREDYFWYTKNNFGQLVFAQPKDTCQVKFSSPRFESSTAKYKTYTAVSDGSIERGELLLNIEHLCLNTLNARYQFQRNHYLNYYLKRPERKNASVGSRTDTRNWQSLPSSIHVCRLPLKNGENIITLSFENGRKVELKVVGNGQMQFKTIAIIK